MHRDTEERKEATSEQVAGWNGKSVDSFPSLMAVDDVAAMLNCSTRTVWRFSDAGKMPRPLRIGGIRRWRKKDVESWLDAGCPAVREGGR
jgi:excisionase family DNA binding protein